MSTAERPLEMQQHPGSASGARGYAQPANSEMLYPIRTETPKYEQKVDRKVTILAEDVQAGPSPLDQALATSDLALARQLVAQRRGNIPEEDFWYGVASHKHLPENQDLLRALLILDRQAATRLARIYPDDRPGTTNVISVLHHGMKNLSKELQDRLREIPYYSPKRPDAINTNCKDGWVCAYLAPLWGHQRSLSSERAFNYNDIAVPETRKEKFDLAEQTRQLQAIRTHTSECYPVLIEPDPDNPGQKTFSDLLVALFDAMSPGQFRQFLVESGNHVMFLDLKKKQESGKDLLVANFFDPNRTNVHKHAQTDQLEVVRKEWTIPAFLHNDNDRQFYWPSGTRHAMVAEVKSWFDLDSLGPIKNNRAVHSLDYTDSPASSEVLNHLSRFSVDQTLRAELKRLDTKEKVSRLSEPDSNGTTPLFMACQNGHTKIVQLIQSALPSEQFAALLKIAAQGLTPLSIACSQGHTDIVQIIQSAVPSEQFAALLKIASIQGSTPLLMACENGHTKIVEFIQSAVPSEQFASLLKIASIQGSTPLWMACQNGHTKIVEFIQSVVSPEQFASLLKIAGPQGSTSLWMACQNGHTKIVEFIQSVVPSEQFASLLKIAGPQGSTPLWMACQNGHTKIVELIQSSVPSEQFAALLESQR